MYHLATPSTPIKGVSKLRIYAVGRNLLLLTNYDGIDPEVNVEGSQRYIDQSYYPKDTELYNRT